MTDRPMASAARWREETLHQSTVLRQRDTVYDVQLHRASALTPKRNRRRRLVGTSASKASWIAQGDAPYVCAAVRCPRAEPMIVSSRYTWGHFLSMRAPHGEQRA